MVQTTMSTALKLEQLVPPDPPQPIMPKNAGRGVRVRLTRDVWPNTKLTKGDRLYAGQTVILPEKEARSLVEYRCAELLFDQPDEVAG